MLAQLHEWFGLEFEKDKSPQPENIVWRYMLKDLIVKYSRRFSLGQLSLPAPEVDLPSDSGRVWAVYEPSDPRPVITELVGYAKTFLSRLLH